MFAGESSLHIAVILGDLDAVQLLLKNKANIHQRATGRFFLPEDQKNNPVKETNYYGMNAVLGTGKLLLYIGEFFNLFSFIPVLKIEAWKARLSVLMQLH